MISRSETSIAQPLNICGSSTFGRYPKISVEKTVNMFLSDGWLVPYAGYQIAIPSSSFGGATQGRGCLTSVKLNRLVTVMDNRVYLCTINFNQMQQKVTSIQATQIGQLQTSTGVVYIKENNKPQILISDNKSLYVYDPLLTPSFQVVSTPDFIPGYIDFHDSYFLCAAQADEVSGTTQTNTWRLSELENGLVWPSDNSSVGELQTKPDNTQAVIRFPGKGNMIVVMGKNVGEPWFDVGYQLFPYQKNTSLNFDFGCLNPATVATLDDMVCWLGVNEKSGPVVMYSDGSDPVKITTDGFDYVISNMQHPEDSQGFMFRQDGHIFYHINFYSDNVSFFIDFLKDGTKKIFHACDENGNYFIASQVAFYNNQYYFISRNNGNVYAFDTIFTTYVDKEIPRIRRCKNIRNEKQEYFIANDCGFTIESGNTNYLNQAVGPIYLTTQDGKRYVTNGDYNYLSTQAGQRLGAQNGENLVSQQFDNTVHNFLIAQQPEVLATVPRVDLAISIDGGEHFSSYDSQYLPPIGQRKNKLMWWQLGAANDIVCEFQFWGIGRFVAYDGVLTTRQ